VLFVLNATYISEAWYLTLDMATYAPEHEPIPESDIPEEFKEPETTEPEISPEKAPEAGLDSGGMGGDSDMEAEVLFQVAHYREEYKAPASLADVAFEIAETDPEIHEMMMDAVKEGTPIVGPVLKRLVDQGLIMETEFGGYITTPDGDEMLKGSEENLGNTYESEKHKGQPEDTAGYDIEDAAEGGEAEPPEEPTEEKKGEGGVPFMSM